MNEIEIKAEFYKRKFYDFIVYFWDTVIREPYIPSEHIKVLCKEFEELQQAMIHNESYDLAIAVPPGTSKSTIFSVMSPVWSWLHNPAEKIITSSYAQPLTNDLTIKSRDILQSSKFKELYPHIELRYDRNQISAYQNKQGGVRFGASVGSAVTGFHFHKLFIDDPLNAIQAQSATYRKRAKEYLFGTMSSRKVDKANSPTILIQQRLHEDDLIGIVTRQKNDNTRMICLPAVLTDDVKPKEYREIYKDGLLDNKRLTQQTLDKEREKVGSYVYNAQYLQAPVSDESALFKLKNNRYCDYENGIIMADNKFIDVNTCNKFLCIDLALTVKETSDYTVIGFFASDKDTNLYLLDILRIRVEGAEHKQLIHEMYNKHNPHTIAIESVQYQASLIQELSKQGLPVEPLKPDKDKYSRAIPASARHESGKIFFNSKLNGLQDIELELQQFPLAEHDDFVDVLAYAVNYVSEHNNRITLINPNIINTRKRKEIWH